MKTKEELSALKEEAETLSRKLHELNKDELNQVVCGFAFEKGFITPYFTVDEGAADLFDCNGYFFRLSNNVMPVEGKKE